MWMKSNVWYISFSFCSFWKSLRHFFFIKDPSETFNLYLFTFFSHFLLKSPTLVHIIIQFHWEIFPHAHNANALTNVIPSSNCPERIDRQPFRETKKCFSVQSFVQKAVHATLGLLEPIVGIIFLHMVLFFNSLELLTVNRFFYQILPSMETSWGYSEPC